MEEVKKKTLGQLLMRKRVELEMTQKEVAEQMGLDRGSYLRFEGDRRYPMPMQRQKVARFLGVDVDDLPSPVLE